jgi:hypothetical protein
MEAALGPDGRGWLVYGADSVRQIRVIPLNAGALLAITPAHKTHKPRPGGGHQKGHPHPIHGRHPIPYPKPPHPKPPRPPNPGPMR